VSISRRPEGYYQSTLLSECSGLSHAFGTACAPPPEGYAFLHQIHSAIVAEPGECAEGDALITRLPGQRIAVKTADCIPLLLHDPHSRAVAAVHAGWRGVVQNIAGAAVAEMGRRYGTQPVDLLAALGPAIGACCFEVGPEVAPLFRDLFPERADLDRQTKVDLEEGVVRQLLQAGLQRLRIDRGAPCTFCGGEEFFSWRRDRVAGQRMYAVIGLED
jgi:hypothetical protein